MFPTPTPTPVLSQDTINKLIELVKNSGSDQQETLLLLILFVMVSTVMVGLVLTLKYKPWTFFSQAQWGKTNQNTMDKLVEVLAEYNENFTTMIYELREARIQEADRVKMRKDDLERQQESLRRLHEKLDRCIEHKET